MPLDILPSYAKIVELQLSIRSAIETPRRPLNRSRAPVASFRELWQGQVAFAANNITDARALAAWFEGKDGRKGAWGLTLKQGFATHANDFAGTLAANLSAGTDILYITRTAGTVQLKAGALLAVGTAGDDSSQVVEVLDAIVAGASVTVYIAPRLRNARALGTAVTGGDVVMPVRLADDDVPLNVTPSHGVISVNVIEAVS